MKRRQFIGTSAAAGIGMLAVQQTHGHIFKPKLPSSPRKGNINHSVCYWCYNSIPLDTFLAHLNSLEIGAIDLVGPEDWPLLKKHNIHASMCWGADLGLTEGWNHTKNHPALIKNYTDMIPKVADAGYTNLICFSGNRNGLSDEEGLRNCVDGLEQVLQLADRFGVFLHMELLNSKVDHKDHMCDHSSWGVELCRRLGTDNFKLLYDIYHMQIMEGDVIRTIRDYHEYIGHYHTGGNPGRHEINETQELYYPAIMKAIFETGFTGHVAQEFIPSWKDKIAALDQGVTICDI
ncbi:MAG: TIM barrel protein [Eudoraea sp.]|nr:TIM barrel protein [Eudoraea sp.]